MTDFYQEGFSIVYALLTEGGQHAGYIYSMLYCGGDRVAMIYRSITVAVRKRFVN